uniref:Expressed protein n=1 Tax=Schizophyllum commune (strain H4-8 / FGSC 9210) TaxID=578458 RepID=D8QLT5_SCHCM
MAGPRKDYRDTDRRTHLKDPRTRLNFPGDGPRIRTGSPDSRTALETEAARGVLRPTSPGHGPHRLPFFSPSDCKMYARFTSHRDFYSLLSASRPYALGLGLPCSVRDLCFARAAAEEEGGAG